jgi:hypothetical protein
VHKHSELQLPSDIQGFVGAAVVNKDDLIYDFVGDGLISNFERFRRIVCGHDDDDFGLGRLVTEK